MNSIQQIAYRAILFLIWGYKNLELQVLLLFTPFLRWKGKRVCERIGVVLHCPGDKGWGDERVGRKCGYSEIVHVNVKDERFFARVANLGSLAFGETFMEGMWECERHEDMGIMCCRVLENNLMDLYWNKWNLFLEWVQLCAFNLQGRVEAWVVGKEHYDLGNDLYEAMLDPWMQYTCGYWRNANNLNEAQVNKMKLIADKLMLKPGMKVLDVGCGWSTLLKYLALNHGVKCVGVTVSQEGAKYGRRVCSGVDVDIRLQDYRDVNEKFDRIVSVGAFEHFGYLNYKSFFRSMRCCLKDDGLMLLHTIGRDHHNIPRSELFLHKYIFPNGNLPNPQDLTSAIHGMFILEDWQNFGHDYSLTLEAWYSNFNKNWGKLQQAYGENFKRMWIFYLQLCRGMFLSRRLQVYQLVLSTDGVKGGYPSVR